MLLFHKSHLSIRFKTFSTSTKPPRSLTWRAQLRQEQLAIKVSSVLLQRRNWVPLLHTLNLSPNLTPSLFLQILHNTRPNPQISIDFFNWARTHLGFLPDLESHSRIVEIAIGSGLYRPANPLFDSLIRIEPAVTAVVDSLVRACRGTDSQSHVLSFVLEAYASKGLVAEGLEVHKEIRVSGGVSSIRSVNALLNALEQANGVGLALCFCGALVRSGVCVDKSTWALMGRFYCKIGKVDTIARMIDAGIFNSDIYNLLIDSYSHMGNFADALDRLRELKDRKIEVNYSMYSSILDGACKHGDAGLIREVMCNMEEKGMLSGCTSVYDSTIQKLCESGKSYAAEMLYRKACDEKARLEDATYGCMLRALSKAGRMEVAIEVYNVISERSVMVNVSCYNAFVDVLCKEDPVEELNGLLKDMIQRGFNPGTHELSKILWSLCYKGRWGEAEEVLNVILEKGVLPDFVCCCLLVEHYCKSGQIDLALALHDRMDGLNGKLDVKTYNVLVEGLFVEKRVEVAARVFDYMRRQNVTCSESYVMMISGLCRENELRRAMKLHDEMLKMRLKPDDARTYKRLITGFR